MTENGAHPLKLEIDMTVAVANKTSGRGYAIAAKTEVEVGDDRQATLLNLLEEIMSSKMTKEMQEVEGWPL